MSQPGLGLESFRLGASIASVAAAAERRQRMVRLLRACVVLSVIVAIGTYVYWWYSDAAYNVIDALYMTIVTVTTVGFQEHIPVLDDAMKGFTIGLILMGGGSMVYFLTAAAALVIEGDLMHGFWQRRLTARLAALEDHLVLVGGGNIGRHALRQIRAAGSDVVVVENDAAVLEELVGEFGEKLLFVHGDAYAEETLRRANVARARGILSCLPDDRDNFLLCVTARQLAPAVHITTRVSEPDNARKFTTLPAETVIPAAMGGIRLANELARPDLVGFTDALLRGAAHDRWLAEVPVAAGSPVCAKTLAEACIETRSECVIMGLRAPDGTSIRYHPPPETVLEGDSVLLLLGTRRELRAARRQVALSRRTRRRQRKAS